MDVDSRLWKCS